MSQNHVIFARGTFKEGKEKILNGLCMTLESLQLHQNNLEWREIFASRAELSKIPNQEEPSKLNVFFIPQMLELVFFSVMVQLL